jgi:hypothetical protein
VFWTLAKFFQEYRLHRRNDQGQVDKENKQIDELLAVVSVCLVVTACAHTAGSADRRIRNVG